MNTLTFLLMTAFGVTATLADPHFYMCTDYKWTGLCHNMPAPLKKCSKSAPLASTSATKTDILRSASQ